MSIQLRWVPAGPGTPFYGDGKQRVYGVIPSVMDFLNQHFVLQYRTLRPNATEWGEWTDVPVVTEPAA